MAPHNRLRNAAHRRILLATLREILGDEMFCDFIVETFGNDPSTEIGNLYGMCQMWLKAKYPHRRSTIRFDPED